MSGLLSGRPPVSWGAAVHVVPLAKRCACPPTLSPTLILRVLHSAYGTSRDMNLTVTMVHSETDACPPKTMSSLHQ